MGLISNDSAVKLISGQLGAFAKLDNFWDLFEVAFGKEYNQSAAMRLRSQWQVEDFSQLPTIAVVSGDVLGNARGAYASSTNMIYLSASFMATASQQTLEAVILEEIGHFVDAQVNATDTRGDEGELFSAVVLGKSLSDEVLQALKSEDDRQVIVVDGKAIEVEMSESDDPTQVWVRQFGSSDDDNAWGISIDSNNNIYVTGWTFGSLPNNSNLGSGDAFIAKYDASGTQLWVNQFGSSSSDIVRGISNDNNANVYIVGYTHWQLA